MRREKKQSQMRKHTQKLAINNHEIIESGSSLFLLILHFTDVKCGNRLVFWVNHWFLRALFSHLWFYFVVYFNIIFILLAVNILYMLFVRLLRSSNAEVDCSAANVWMLTNRRAFNIDSSSMRRTITATQSMKLCISHG